MSEFGVGRSGSPLRPTRYFGAPLRTTTPPRRTPPPLERIDVRHTAEFVLVLIIAIESYSLRSLERLRNAFLIRAA